MFNLVRKHHAKSNGSPSHYCYIATEEKTAGKILLQFDKGDEKGLKTGQHDLKWYLCSN